MDPRIVVKLYRQRGDKNINLTLRFDHTTESRERVVASFDLLRATNTSIAHHDVNGQEKRIFLILVQLLQTLVWFHAPFLEVELLKENEICVLLCSQFDISTPPTTVRISSPMRNVNKTPGKVPETKSTSVGSAKRNILRKGKTGKPQRANLCRDDDVTFALDQGDPNYVRDDDEDNVALH